MATPDEMPHGSITVLLQAARGGDAAARDELFRRTLEPLKSIARNHLQRCRMEGCKEEASLVHDAVLRLLEHEKLDAQNRRQFFFIMKRAMHDVLVEQFKKADAQKNGGGWKRVPFMELQSGDRILDVTPEELEAALDALEAVDADAAHAYMLVELYGSTIEGAGDVLDRSFAQTRRDLDYAGPWLRRFLRRKLGSGV